MKNTDEKEKTEETKQTFIMQVSEEEELIILKYRIADDRYKKIVHMLLKSEDLE